MKPAELVTITKLAKQAVPPLPRQKLYRRLRAIHELHGGEWFVRAGRNILINPTTLRAQHPGVFDPPDLVARVGDLEDRVTIAEREIQAVAQQVGASVRRIKALERPA